MTRLTYLRVFWSLLRQSADTWLRFARRKRVTSLSRLVLGAKQPVASHISSQPRSSLARLRLSVNCLMIWQYTSSLRISCNKRKSVFLMAHLVKHWFFLFLSIEGLLLKIPIVRSSSFHCAKWESLSFSTERLSLNNHVLHLFYFF